MPHTGFTRVSRTAVAILVGLLAAVLLGPAPIKAMNDFHFSYNFMPAGVTPGQEVRLTYHNFTNGQVKVQFILLNANGADIFTENQINGTFVIGPGMMATAVIPSNGILGPNDMRAEVTGVVALSRVPPQKPVKAGSFFIGPASVQIVDELTQQTRVSVGVIGPVDLVGIAVPTD